MLLGQVTGVHEPSCKLIKGILLALPGMQYKFGLYPGLILTRWSSDWMLGNRIANLQVPSDTLTILLQPRSKSILILLRSPASLLHLRPMDTRFLPLLKWETPAALPLPDVDVSLIGIYEYP